MRWREPWRVLVPLLAAQWIAQIVFALSVHHNGFLYYQGGDQIWYYTTGWLAGHGFVPKTLISPAWALLLAPFAQIAGPGYVSALPVAIVIEALVLTPIALFCVYDIASRVAGRIVGYVAAALWVFGPYVAIPLFKQAYHSKYVDQFLPHPLGLTMMGDFPSVVALLAAGALILRAYQTRRAEWAIVAGLVTGLAVLTKASNLIFLATPLVLFLVGKRWRELGTFALALVPALGALALWKYRGYGTLPAFGNGMAQQHLALGSHGLAATTGSIFTPLHKYVSINWSNLQNNLDGLGEQFFSLRVLEFLPFAGGIAVARRSWRLAVALSVWFWLYFVIKGSDAVSSVDSASFFRLLLPAIPPLVVMVACLPVLIPRLGPALAERFPAPVPRVPGRRVLIGAAVIFALVPFVAAAGLQRISTASRSIIVHQIAVPVDSGVGLSAAPHAGTVSLRWKDSSEGSTRVFYRVLRRRGPTDVACLPSSGTTNCYFSGRPLRTVRITSTVDHPPPGTWTYRITVAANWVDDPKMGDTFLVSAPVTVTVR